MKATTNKTVFNHEISEGDVMIVRKYLKERLIIHKELRGYSQEKEQLLGILQRTIQLGESDSVLIIGPPGSGKTLLISECLREISDIEGSEDSIIIKLNGLVHTDDSLALREVIQQLHIDELKGDKISGSFSDNLAFVLHSLRSGQKSVTKPLIFILDEFQLFCQHRNQTLLYNLFDVVQSAQAPTCVIGLTCRIDITEMLEKRVKSRFSQRQIMLFPNSKFEDHLDDFKLYLSLPESSKGVFSCLKHSYVKKWNQEIVELTKLPKVIQLLRRYFEIDHNERKFKNILFQMVCDLDSNKPFINIGIVEEVLKEFDKDRKVELMKDLSVLELCLVIAICHQVDIYDGAPFNFEMITNRYLKFTSQYSVPLTQRSILLKAFERIKELELILPVSGGSKTVKKEYELYTFVVTKLQVTEAVNSYFSLPTEVSQWANSIT